MRIPLSNRPELFAVVDEEDADLVELRWSLSRNGYARHSRWVDGRARDYLMHRLVLGLEHGDGTIVDHRNGDRLDNRRANLRIVTAAGNARNRRSRTGSSSRFVGVTWHARAGRWQAQVKRDGRTRYLGLHPTEEDAAQAVAAYLEELEG